MIRDFLAEGTLKQGQELVIACNIVTDIKADDDAILCVPHGNYCLYLTGGTNYTYDICVNEDDTMVAKGLWDRHFADDGILTFATNSSSKRPTNYKFIKIS